MPVDHDKIREGVALILTGLGLDITEGALPETPDRVARAFEEICSGADMRPEDVVNVFHEADYDEMVLVRDIPFYSMC